MKVLGVVGPSDAGKTTLVERLTARLADRGTVSTIKHLTHEPDVDREGKDTARHRAAGAAATVGLTDDGEWFATGSSASLETVLDRLAPGTDYVLVEGYADSTLPKVVLGNKPAADPVVASAADSAAIDVDAVLATIDDLEPRETVSSLVARAKRTEDADRAGAVATFTGRVRTYDHEDDVRTERLEFERYDGVAADRTAAIAADLEARDGVFGVLFHHRTGVVPAGEDVVYVVVLAGHRAEAFAAVEDGIDRLKEEVSLFKKEVTVEGEYWAHERGEP